MYLSPRDEKLRFVDRMSIREMLERMTKKELSELNYEGKVFGFTEKEMKKMNKDKLVKIAEKFLVEYHEERLRNSDRPYEPRVMKDLNG